MRGRWLGREDSLEWEMVTHSSILAWEILWTEEPAGLQYMGSQSRTRLSTQTYSWCHRELLIMGKNPTHIWCQKCCVAVV